jgi:hypothetical protein
MMTETRIGLRRRVWRCSLGLAGVSVLTLSLSCINPALLNQGTGALYPLAPGDTPFVMLLVVNDTTADLDVTFNVDYGALQPVPYFFKTLSPGIHERGALVPYPFLRVAIGSLTNPFDPSIVAHLPTGLTVQVPFGHAPLVAGQDFQRGDTLVFHLVGDTRSASAITVDVGRIAGSSQTGPFTRADTFQTVELLLLQNGLTGNGIPTSTTP